MRKLVVSSVVAASLATSALAHFQMLYTPNMALTKGGTIPLVHTFTHPFADEHTMDMAGVEEFYVVTEKGGKKDLKSTLKSIDFKGKANAGKGYASSYKARSIGDHVLVMVPTPYYDEKEEAYMQQITKTVVNVAGVPNGWDATLGLDAEIVPLTKPYAIWEGGSFTGIVMSNGKPVPYAEIEVEYINSEVDVKNYSLGKNKFTAPQDSFVTMGIKANKDGEFTFALPKAGMWGFAALGVGSEKTYKGKKYNADAVIWVDVKEMK